MNLPADVLAALRRMGLVDSGDDPPAEALSGGVSSDIWRIDLDAGPVCVKRALARLRVEADWRAPVERNRYEVEWFRVAATLIPGAVPRVVAADPDSGLFAMEYLDPADHPVWKYQLRDGVADPTSAAAVGSLLATVHAGTAHDGAVAARFPTDAIFHAIRLDPYLLATAARHPAHADALGALAERTAATRVALVHGDVSPKNILIGPHGPVFLDAETAWYGDPAFDIAFCLNHLLLKCLWNPAASGAFMACFDALAEAYLGGVTWEDPSEVDGRAATLLPGLLLARVDGKSPVEYVKDEADREAVRAVAGALLARPVARLDDVGAAWADR